MGDKEDWKAAKQMEPKLRTFVPVIVRGEEGEGVRFWGFGKTVYQEILGYIADPDYGDITDPQTGRDLTIEYTSAEDAGTSYPTTTIRVKPKESSLGEDDTQVQDFLQNQTEITELYQELSYDELKDVLESWLNPSGEVDDVEDSVSQETLSTSTSNDSTPPFDPDTKTETKSTQKVDDVASAFDDLFNS